MMMMVLVKAQRHSWREHPGQHNGQSVIWHACQLLTHLTLRRASDSPGEKQEKLNKGETGQELNQEEQETDFCSAAPPISYQALG